MKNIQAFKNKKQETFISIMLIIFYVVLNSFVMQNYDLTDYRCFLFNFVFLAGIIIFIRIKKLDDYYGFCKVSNSKKFLYFIPLILISTANIWNGININNSISEIVIYMFSMLCVGFLEEIIFRGFLFKMMAKDNLKSAIIVSSLTFGIGHVVNLLNGALFIPTLIQICYAISLGFLFVFIFIKSNSLWPCIIVHGVFNALGIFSVDSNISIYVVPLILIVITTMYSLYIFRGESKC